MRLPPTRPALRRPHPGATETAGADASRAPATGSGLRIPDRGGPIPAAAPTPAAPKQAAPTPVTPTLVAPAPVVLEPFAPAGPGHPRAATACSTSSPRRLDRCRSIRGGRHGWRVVAVIVAGGLAFGLLSFGGQRLPSIVLASSPSVPPGLYRVLPGEPWQRHSYVLFEPPLAARARRGETLSGAAGARWLKRVIALEGDRVCASDSGISVNGQRSPFGCGTATRSPHTARLRNRLRPAWSISPAAIPAVSTRDTGDPFTTRRSWRR